MGERLKGIPGFSIDEVAAAAGSDPEILRMENVDTDIPPPAAAVEATRAAVATDEANSWLPFTGVGELKHEVARLIVGRGGPQYDPESEVVITSGEGDNMLDALPALTDPGDEVIVPDPTYAGMLQRVRLAGDVPRPVPLQPTERGWRWDLDALEAAVSDRTRAIFLGNRSFPSGWVLNDEEWAAVQRICTGRQIPLLYWSAMEAIVFGGTPMSPSTGSQRSASASAPRSATPAAAPPLRSTSSSDMSPPRLVDARRIKRVTPDGNRRRSADARAAESMTEQRTQRICERCRECLQACAR